MKKSTMIVVAIIAIILMILIGAIKGYNGMVSKQEDVNNQLTDLDDLLKEKIEMVSELTDVVRIYFIDEYEIVQEVNYYKNKMVSADTLERKSKANDELTVSLNNLILKINNNEELRNSENFVQVYKKFLELEEKIASITRYYNNAVNLYNASINKFPNTFLASKFEMKEKFEINIPNIQELESDILINNDIQDQENNILPEEVKPDGNNTNPIDEKNNDEDDGNGKENDENPIDESNPQNTNDIEINNVSNDIQRGEQNTNEVSNEIPRRVRGE